MTGRPWRYDARDHALNPHLVPVFDDGHRDDDADDEREV